MTDREIVKAALAKLNDSYAEVFQNLSFNPFPFEWIAVGGTIVEHEPFTPKETAYDNTVAYFEENIDARFTALMWRTMKPVRVILKFYASSQEPITLEAIAIARAILEEEK